MHHVHTASEQFEVKKLQGVTRTVVLYVTSYLL